MPSRAHLQCEGGGRREQDRKHAERTSISESSLSRGKRGDTGERGSYVQGVGGAGVGRPGGPADGGHCQPGTDGEKEAGRGKTDPAEATALARAQKQRRVGGTA